MPTDELEDELRRTLARTAADFESLDQARQRLLQRDYHPRLGNLRLATGIIAGAAGVALVVGLGVSGVFGSASHPASHLAHARLAAWTVTKEADGRIFLKIRELRDPAALQRKLRADGVPASVVFHPGPPVEVVRPLALRPLQEQPVPGIQRRGRPGAERGAGREPADRDVPLPLGHPQRRRRPDRRHQKPQRAAVPALRVAGPSQPAVHRQLSLGRALADCHHSSRGHTQCR